MTRFGGLRVSSAAAIKRFAIPQIKKRAFNSWYAVQDTFYSTKDTFERHKVVFTISTSLASVATAWLGYTLRHLHQTKVERRLDSIEHSMKSSYNIQHNELKKIVGASSYNPAKHIVIAGASLIIGYGLGWRGGRWYANRMFRKEQMKLLGQIKPRRWPLRLLRRSFIRPKSTETATEASTTQGCSHITQPQESLSPLLKSKSLLKL